MKTLNQTRTQRRPAFTLIELLVVIAIIGILAALVFPAMKAAKIAGLRGKVQAEMRTVEMAIEAYKTKYGFYPPDNGFFPPKDPSLDPYKVITNQTPNQLFYELQGTTQKGATFETLDGGERILQASVPVAFGTKVDGFVNVTKEGAADDSKVAQKFLNNLRTDQYSIVTTPVRYGVLVCPVPWPADKGNVIAGVPEVNPWRYNSSSPLHNPKSFDLWVDVIAGGKTNRISNWNQQYDVVN